MLLARELSGGAQAVIFTKPTYGLDVQNTASTRRRIREAADAGMAIVLISTDLDELLELADRIAVMSRRPHRRHRRQRRRRPVADRAADGRSGMTQWSAMSRPMASAAVARPSFRCWPALGLLIAGASCWLLGVDPLDYYAYVRAGDCCRRSGIQATLTRMAPLLLIAAGLIVAFRPACGISAATASSCWAPRRLPRRSAAG